MKQKIRVGSKVRWTHKYINDWIFSPQNYDCYSLCEEDLDFYAETKYDQEIILAMITLMGGPKWGMVKALGADEDIFLVLFMDADCEYWGYVEAKDLELM